MENASTRQDGNQEIKPISIPFKKTECRTKLNLLTFEDEPIAVYYFQTGWDYGYPTYHVIVEYGDIDQTDNLFLSQEQFIAKFGVDPTK
jgi:hypothetical protein